MDKQLLSLVTMSAALLLGSPIWADSPPVPGDPGAVSNEFSSQWVQVDMNWLPAPGSDAGISSISAAQRAISYDGGAVPADAGLSNTSGGMVSPSFSTGGPSGW